MCERAYAGVVCPYPDFAAGQDGRIAEIARGFQPPGGHDFRKARCEGHIIRASDRECRCLGHNRDSMEMAFAAA